MRRPYALPAVALFLFALVLAAPGLQAAGSPVASDSLAWMTPSHPTFVRVDCGKAQSQVSVEGEILIDPKPIEPREGYPIDLHNGCGCPTLGIQWTLESHSCKLQPGGATCNGFCIWTTYRNGYPISNTTDCGTL